MKDTSVIVGALGGLVSPRRSLRLLLDPIDVRHSVRKAVGRHFENPNDLGSVCH